MAQDEIEARVTPLLAELRPLEGCIGQILRQDVYAERDNPPFDRVCMDGIAVDSAALDRGLRRYTIQATQPAGAVALELAGADNAIEVMTGAILPRGTNCIIPLEEYDLQDKVVALKPQARGSPYRNVQRRGADSQPGEPMLRAGTRLRAPEVAVVASAGLAQVRVSRQPRFMVISTGDELVEPGEPIAEHQVRRSNAYAMVAALRSRGFEHVANDHLLDNEGMLSERLRRHLAEQDVLVVSGGVSKGKFDLVPKILQDLGVEEVFHYVAQRPGAPMWFGAGPRGQLVFGLPGNPVSTLICLIRFVVPAALLAMGAPRTQTELIPLGAPFERVRAMTYFLPVSVCCDEHGKWSAVPRPTNGPGDFLALSGADGFVELPPNPEPYPEGFVARLYRW